jgi:SAM-dependent methyltransferase
MKAEHNSKEYYNKLAKEYNEKSKNRIQYLNSVDELIIKSLGNKKIINYLDIGSGDGRRASKIKQELNIEFTTLLDESEAMLKTAQENEYSIVNKSFFEFETSEKYDLITCLWNVLGHFDSFDSRLLFFKKVSNLLSEEGLLVFDVNNRYNINHYGYKNVAQNLYKDHLQDDDRGLFSLGLQNIETTVYVHSPFDILTYIKNSELYILKEYYPNYNTGEIESTYFEGQLLYFIQKR